MFNQLIIKSATTVQTIYPIPISIMSVITKQITIDDADTIIKIQSNPPSIQSNILWIQVLMHVTYVPLTTTVLMVGLNTVLL